MPASFGFHPALRWPLPGGGARADQAILFDEDEHAPIRRLDADGLLAPDPRPTPVDGRKLTLHDDLFVEDAMIMDRIASRRLMYGAPGGTQIVVDFANMPQLGLWSKPGAGFLCIEPWQGYADPAGYDGDIADKPGVSAIGPGAQRTFEMGISVKQAG